MEATEILETVSNVDISTMEVAGVAFILFAVGALIGIIAFHILSRKWIA